MCIGVRILYPIETGKSARKRATEIWTSGCVRDLNVIVACLRGFEFRCFFYRHRRPKRE